VQWNPDEPDMPENANGFDMPSYSNSFLRLRLLGFSINLSISTLLLEADLSLLNIMKIMLYVEIGVLIEQKWQ